MEIQELQDMITRANGRAKSRILSLEQVQEQIALAQQVVSELPKETWTDLRFKFIESVPNSCRYTAHATELTCAFDEQGKAKNIHVRRTYAPYKPYGGYQRHFYNISTTNRLPTYIPF